MRNCTHREFVTTQVKPVLAIAFAICGGKLILALLLTVQAQAAMTVEAGKMQRQVIGGQRLDLGVDIVSPQRVNGAVKGVNDRIEMVEVNVNFPGDEVSTEQIGDDHRSRIESRLVLQ